MATAELTPERLLDLLSEPGQPFFRNRNVVVFGDVYLSRQDRARGGIKRIPSVLIVGNLDGTGDTDIEELDCQVTGAVDGDVTMDGSSLVRTGPNFSVQRTFSARRCKRLESLAGVFKEAVILSESGLESIGRAVSIGGDLDISGCSRLRVLDCRVTGDLMADDSGLTEFGPSFSVGGNVSLQECPDLKMLGYIGTPDNVRLARTGIPEIRGGFECRGNLSVLNCDRLGRIGGVGTVKIGGDVELFSCGKLGSVWGVDVGGKFTAMCCRELGRVTGEVFGSAVFQRCGISLLDGNLRVGRNLTVDRCRRLKHIQGGGFCGNVVLRDLSGFEETRETFECRGTLHIKNCPKFRRLAGYCGGSVYPEVLPSLENIDQDFRAGGGLCLRGKGDSGTGKPCGIRSVNAEFGEDVIIQGAILFSEFGKNFSCRGLLVEDCPNFKIVRGAVRDDSVILNSGLEAAGADFDCGGDLSVIRCPRFVTANCRVEGSLAIRQCQFERTGPALEVRDLVIEDSGTLQRLSGSVEHDIRVVRDGKILPWRGFASPLLRVGEGRDGREAIPCSRPKRPENPALRDRTIF